MNSRYGKHRVLLVLLLFMPLTLVSLWYVGGNQQEFELSVTSAHSPEELQDRFDRIVASLAPMSEDELARHARQSLELGPYEMGIARPVHFLPSASLVGSGFPTVGVSVWQNLLADIVPPDLPANDLSLEIDPAIVYCDSEFENYLVNRSWLGKDQTSIYLREIDEQQHLRLVRLQREGLRFEPLVKDGSKGCRVIYSFSLQHTGLKRIYGKFLERECESLARNRLEWICGQLEAEEDR